jgi:threonine synthase
MREVEKYFHYVMDPHTAVGYLAMQEYLKQYRNHQGIILSTAHPAKFLPDVERILGHSIHVPERLANLEHAPKLAVRMNASYDAFKSWLLSNMV